MSRRMRLASLLHEAVAPELHVSQLHHRQSNRSSATPSASTISHLTVLFPNVEVRTRVFRCYRGDPDLLTNGPRLAVSVAD